MPTQIELIKKYQIPLRGQSGQNFLIDPNTARKIVDLADPQTSDVVLEIGPGLGALTSGLLERGAEVWAVEKDGRLAGILEEELDGTSGGRLKVFHEDILQTDLRKILRGGRNKRRTLKVVGNLPYYITTPIIFRLVEWRDRIHSAVLTVQKEVADRILAEPATKDYGRLTLGVRLFAEVRRAFNISPTCFAPRPEVASSTLVLRFHPAAKLPSSRLQALVLDLIRIAFSHRRKTLLHNLSHEPSIGKTREEAALILSRVGLSEWVRPEELFLKDYLALAEVLS